VEPRGRPTLLKKMSHNVANGLGPEVRPATLTSSTSNQCPSGVDVVCAKGTFPTRADCYQCGRIEEIDSLWESAKEIAADTMRELAIAKESETYGRKT
jgi:hypothetical protein